MGVGGIGVVLRATHLDLEAQVAIKVIRPEFATSEEVVGRMLFEARAVAKLRSAHVVRVLDVARLESGSPYIVMELLEGCDLATMLERTAALPVQQAVDYLLQACEGLVEAHALGIVHRDLKPENLFIADTPEGSVLKLLDFGISKAIGSTVPFGPRMALTNAGSALGSPHYMSPEQMRAAPDVDTRADIWSLGAILFELVSGRCPFEGESVAVVCSNVLGQEPPSLAETCGDAPEQLDAIVRRCLQKAREDRFQNVAELAAALRDFASEAGQRSADRSWRLASGISVRRDVEKVRAELSSSNLSWRAETPPRLRSEAHSSSRLNRSLVAATLLLAVGALGWWSWNGRRDPIGVRAQVAPAALAPEPIRIAPPRIEQPPDAAALPAAPATLAPPPALASPASKPQRWKAKPPTRVTATARPTPPPALSIETTKTPRKNAWDVDRFGGRY